MSRSTDEGLRVSELKLCELVGVSQQYRQSLVKRGLLARAGRSGCTATDAVELATIERLGHHLRPGEVAVAWKDLRPQMRTIVPKGRLDVVFDSQLGSAAYKLMYPTTLDYIDALRNARDEMGEDAAYRHLVDVADSVEGWCDRCSTLLEHEMDSFD
jgi:hypothetical protein